MVMQRNDRLRWDGYFDSCEPYKTDFFGYIHYDKMGDPDAYIIYNFSKDSAKEVSIDAAKGFCFTNEEGLKALLCFLSTYFYHATTVKLYLPKSIELNLLLPEVKRGGREIKREVIYYGMARVINAEAVLSSAKYIGTGSFTIKINDPSCQWNNKCYFVNFGEYKTTVTKGDIPDIEMDIKAFCVFITGKVGIENACYIPEVKINGNIDNLKKAFYKKSLWLEDHF